MKNDKQWSVTPVGRYIHVIPINDLVLHKLSDKCECVPTSEDNGMIIVTHHSYDGREADEPDNDNFNPVN